MSKFFIPFSLVFAAFFTNAQTIQIPSEKSPSNTERRSQPAPACGANFDLKVSGHANKKYLSVGETVTVYFQIENMGPDSYCPPANGFDRSFSIFSQELTDMLDAALFSVNTQSVVCSAATTLNGIPVTATCPTFSTYKNIDLKTNQQVVVGVEWGNLVKMEPQNTIAYSLKAKLVRPFGFNPLANPAEDVNGHLNGLILTGLKNGDANYLNDWKILNFKPAGAQTIPFSK